VATARRPEEAEAALKAHGERVLVLPLDVTDTATIETAVAAATDRFGRIDVLVNNAGYGQLGYFEELSPESIERQFATNVFGVFNVTRAVLPVMRAQRSGMTGVVGATEALAREVADGRLRREQAVPAARRIILGAVGPGAGAAADRDARPARARD
jgi:NAD(P)-dependent dehydrogenase (short-subunit alcohol dehydrogenase family)